MLQQTPERRLGRIMRLGVAVAALAVFAATTAHATASLRLYPDAPDGGGGQLVSHTPFTLYIANDGHGGGDNTAYGVQLIVAASDPSLLGSVTISDGDLISVTLTGPDFMLGSPVLPCDGRPMPPHGIYPAAFATIDLGDLEQGAVLSLVVEYDGQVGLALHFDAIGEGLKANGGCRDVYNPFGHDVTAVVPDDGQGPPPPADCELDIDKTSDVDAVEIGEQVVFTITVTELSGCELTAVTVTDFIPFVDDGIGDVPAFTVLGTDPAATVSTTEVVWDVGALPPDGSVVMTMTVVFEEPAADGHVVINSACALSDQTAEACDAVEIAVGEVTETQPIGGPGFWCRQIRAALDGAANAQFTIEQLEGWRDAVNPQSIVFPELWDTTTLEGMRELLCRPSTLRSAAERLMRHLLTLWLNVASERLDPSLTLGDLCAGSEPLPDGADPSWTIDHVLGQAETALDSGADDQELLFWKDVIDFVNNARLPEDCGAALRHARGSRRLMP